MSHRQRLLAKSSGDNPGRVLYGVAVARQHDGVHQRTLKRAANPEGEHTKNECVGRYSVRGSKWGLVRLLQGQMKWWIFDTRLPPHPRAQEAELGRG